MGQQMDKKWRAIAWGVAASAIAFWINKLIEGQFPKLWTVLLIVPVAEEVAKYLGICRTRSLIIPIIFLISEAVVQISGRPLLIRDTWMVWLLYIPISIVTLKHILFYIVMYLCDYRLHGLVLAIAAHSVWNWYVVASKEWEGIPLGLIALAVTILPVMALYKDGKEGK